MNEISKPFNYDAVDEETAQYLKAKAFSINEVVARSGYEIGGILYEAQQRLAKKGYGCFEEWYRSLGFKKTESYQYINHYNFVRSESEQSKIELFESLPKSLQSEISKPSANEVVNQAVFDGGITTHKAYKEMERQLKQKDRIIQGQENELKAKDDELYLANQRLEREKNKPVEVVEVEKLPEDYEQLKRTNQQLKEEYQKLLDERSITDEQSRKYEELTQFIKEAEGKLSDTQKKIADFKEIHTLIKESNQFLLKASALSYLDIGRAILEDPFIKKEFDSLLSNLKRFNDNIKELSQSHIIEGEIIND